MAKIKYIDTISTSDYTTTINITDYIPESDKNIIKESGPIDCINGRLSIRKIETEDVKMSLVSNSVVSNLKLGIEDDGKVYILVDSDRESVEPKLSTYYINGDTESIEYNINSLEYNATTQPADYSRFSKGTKIYGVTIHWYKKIEHYIEIEKDYDKICAWSFNTNRYIQGYHRSVVLMGMNYVAVLSRMYICYNKITDNSTDTIIEGTGSVTLPDGSSKCTYKYPQNNTGIGESKVLYIDFNSNDVQKLLTGRTNITYTTWIEEGTIQAKLNYPFSTPDGLTITAWDNYGGVTAPTFLYEPNGDDFGVSLHRGSTLYIDAPEGYYITALGWSGAQGAVGVLKSSPGSYDVVWEDADFDTFTTLYKYGNKYTVTSLTGTAVTFPDTREGDYLVTTDTQNNSSVKKWPVVKYSSSTTPSSEGSSGGNEDNPSSTPSGDTEDTPSTEQVTNTRYKVNIKTTSTNVELNNVIHYTDTNTEGYVIDPTALLYIGGEDIVPLTMTAKDNTMFYGNYMISRPDIQRDSFIPGYIRGLTVNTGYRRVKIPGEAAGSTISVINGVETPIDIRWGNIKEEIWRANSGAYEVPNGRIIVAVAFSGEIGGKIYTAELYAYASNKKLPSDKYVFTWGNAEAIKMPSSKNIKGTPAYDVNTPKNNKFVSSIYAWIGNIDNSWYKISNLYLNGELCTFDKELPVRVEDDIEDLCKDDYSSEGFAVTAISAYMAYGHQIKIHLRSLKTPLTVKEDKIDTSSFYPEDQPLNVVDIDTSYNSTTSPKGFKRNEIYRLGVQFQHVTGKWSEPIFISDEVMEAIPLILDESISGKYRVIPTFTSSINTTCINRLHSLGYRNMRALIVQPSLLNRRVLAQGILCPTVYNTKDHKQGSPHFQSSWFARVVPAYANTDGDLYTGGYPQWKNEAGLFTSESNSAEIESNLHSSLEDVIVKTERTTSILNSQLKSDRFKVSYKCQTLHSPDVEFNEDLWSIDYTEGFKMRIIGRIPINYSAGDVYLSTSSPSLNPLASGFIHDTTFDAKGGRSLICGRFYNGGIVDYETENNSTKFKDKDHCIGNSASIYFKIYPWHSSGSLTNDINRPANSGTTSSVLKRKIISNIKFSDDVEWLSSRPSSLKTLYDLGSSKINVFHSDHVSMIRVGGYNYYGNIDTVINPFMPYSPEFYVDTTDSVLSTSASEIPAVVMKPYDTLGNIYTYNGSTFERHGEVSLNSDLYYNKAPIRMKYKSTPHFVVYTGDEYETPARWTEDYLTLAEVYRDNANYGGTDPEYIKSQTWIPAGDITPITDSTITWKYGDTYYQRYDCLKTYPYTEEDENGIVDIVSFMCETRVNLGGRYDKNRGQISNLYMRPTNFNLLNPVYNQQDNYFNYRMLDEDYYKISHFETDVTWSLQKTNAEEIDNFTKTNLASTMSIDGNKGPIKALENWQQHIYSFQDKGISEILFNSRVQIPVTEGQPIEISNNLKVSGNQYLSDGMGCSNKWSISNTPSGLYFIEHKTRELYHLGQDGLKPVSSLASMSSWFKNNVVDRTWYDSIYNDLYVNTDKTSLVYSEQTASFHSFMDYQEAKNMFNMGKGLFALTGSYNLTGWRLGATNKYCNIFGKYRDYSISLISNLDAAMSKIFNNMDIRADWFKVKNGELFKTEDFFDTIQITNEYQDTGVVKLNAVRDANNPLPNLAKKFRIWNIQLPRDAKNPTAGTLRNRISNTWCKITLNKLGSKSDTNKMELHDLGVSYYI